MSRFQAKRLSKNALSHVVGYRIGTPNSPTLVAIGGIHGNEHAGVIALRNIMQHLDEYPIPFEGSFFALQGNNKALALHTRYIDIDLNRIWTPRHLFDVDALTGVAEQEELMGLYELIAYITSTTTGPCYFLDLHTTSSQTSPFITISDALNNRSFSSQFKIPVILGIEEQLEGALLSYINEYGHVALGFEAGQHDDELSAKHCYTMVTRSLVLIGCIQKKYADAFKAPSVALSNQSHTSFYHITDRYSIAPNEVFHMLPGYDNFQRVRKGTTLAISNGKRINAKANTVIFMPLYQQQGDDGFFMVHRLSRFWLQLSSWVRKCNLYRILPMFPGVRRVNDYTLEVNPKVAKFKTTRIFHLFGYRAKQQKGAFWYFTRRDRTTIALPKIGS